MKTIRCGAMALAVLAGTTQLAIAGDKIQVSKACLEDLLSLTRVHYYDMGFRKVANLAFDEMKRIKRNIHNVETEDHFNGAIKITNKIVDLTKSDSQYRKYSEQHARMEGKYNAPDGKALTTLRRLVFGSKC